MRHEWSRPGIIGRSPRVALGDIGQVRDLNIHTSCRPSTQGRDGASSSEDPSLSDT